MVPAKANDKGVVGSRFHRFPWEKGKKLVSITMCRRLSEQATRGRKGSFLAMYGKSGRSMITNRKDSQFTC